MNKMSPKLRFAGKVKELAYMSSFINIVDDRQVIVENCKQILECNEVLAKIMTNSFEVEIWGSGLSLCNYTTDSVEINGKIQSVSLTSKRIMEKRL